MPDSETVSSVVRVTHAMVNETTDANKPVKTAGPTPAKRRDMAPPKTKATREMPANPKKLRTPRLNEQLERDAKIYVARKGSAP